MFALLSGDPAENLPKPPPLNKSKLGNREYLLAQLLNLIENFGFDASNSTGIGINLSGWQMTPEQRVEFAKSMIFAKRFLEIALALKNIKSSSPETESQKRIASYAKQLYMAGTGISFTRGRNTELNPAGERYLLASAINSALLEEIKEQASR